MSDLLAPTRAVIVVTDDTTADELAETLAILNAEAKAMSRRGHYGTETAAYRLQHERIDAVLGEYLAKAHGVPA